MDKVIIKFNGSWRGYSAGEVAGFTADIAESLVGGGRAELHDPKKSGKPASARSKSPAKVNSPNPQPGPADQDDDPNANPDPGANPDPDADDEKP